MLLSLEEVVYVSKSLDLYTGQLRLLYIDAE
jgi:hypothetical protein